MTKTYATLADRIASQDRDTRDVTAFRSYKELLQACLDQGYVPTIPRGDYWAERLDGLPCEHNELAAARDRLRACLVRDGFAVWPE